MKILITGASGHFGGSAARGLVERVGAESLILMSRKPEKLEAFKKAGADVRYGDYREPESLQEAAKGADRMLLISGLQVGHRIKQHGNAIDAAKKAGVGQIMYTSYMAAVPENPAMVTADHYGTEQLLKKSGVAYTIMRDGMYSNSVLDASAPSVLTSGKWITSGDDGKMSFVDRDDCVACAVAVLAAPEGDTTHHNKTYGIYGHDVLSFRDIADIFTEITGKQIDMVPVGDDGMYAHFDAMGIPRDPMSEFNVGGYEWCSDDMVSYERAVRVGFFNVTSDDIPKLIGREPKTFRERAHERADYLLALVPS